MNLKAQIHRISCFPYRHFERSQEIFLALRSFLFLSQKVSPFPLSHIGRYTPYRHFERSEKSSLHSVVSCFFHGKFPLFPLSHIRRYTGVPKRSLGFARDDDTGIALSKHIRCTLREINPFPHTVISSAVEKSSLHSVISCSFPRKGFPFSAISHGTLYQYARKIPPLRSG